MSPAGAFWLGAFVFALIEAGGFGFVHFFQRENRKCAAPPLPPSSPPLRPPCLLALALGGAWRLWGGDSRPPVPGLALLFGGVLGRRC